MPEVKKITVIATAEGYDGLQIRQAGDEFQMPEGSFGTWFEAKDAKAQKANAARQEENDKAIAEENEAKLAAQRAADKAGV